MMESCAHLHQPASGRDYGLQTGKWSATSLPTYNDTQTKTKGLGRVKTGRKRPTTISTDAISDGRILNAQGRIKALWGHRPKIFCGTPLRIQHISLQYNKHHATSYQNYKKNDVCILYINHVTTYIAFFPRFQFGKFWNNTFQVSVVCQVCSNGQERQLSHTACLGQQLNAADSSLSSAQKTISVLPC